MASYRLRINELQRLGKDKRPPRNLWDKPYRLSQYLDEIFSIGKGPKETDYIDLDYEDVE